MAKRPVTRELYAKLVAGFLDAPGNASHAARVAGCERRMAARGWNLGWPVYPWAEPISRVVERRQAEEQARKRAEELEAARAAARVKDGATEEAIKVRGEEGRLVAAARINVILLLNATGRLGPALQILSDQLRVAIEDGQLPPKELAGLLRNVAGAAASAVKAGQTALELERLFKGDPTKIIGLQPVAPAAFEPDAALEEIAAAQEVAQRWQRRGLTLVANASETAEEVAS